ncbi:MAG: hypothetical protein K2Q32_03370 [Alphaproteobacteria bacterium]|nr:hypothetical protein [Alphaproteobacteria bacterium]
MHDLNALTLATYALIYTKPLLPLHATNSNAFNEAWGMYIQTIEYGLGHLHAHWMHTKRMMNSAHIDMKPDSTIQIASRFIAQSYILCGHEMGSLHQQDPAHIARSKHDARKEISAHSKLMMDAVKETHTRINQIDLPFKEKSSVREAIGEFYSLALIALYETRREVDPKHHAAINETLDLCEDALSPFKKHSLVSDTLAKQLDEQRRFRLGVPLGMQARSNDQQQPHWQRMTQTPTRPTGSHTAQPGAPVGEGNNVVIIDDFKKRRAAEKAKKNLARKQGVPSPDDPN